MKCRQNKFSKFFDAPITCSPRKVNRLAPLNRDNRWSLFRQFVGNYLFIDCSSPTTCTFSNACNQMYCFFFTYCVSLLVSLVFSSCWNFIIKKIYIYDIFDRIFQFVLKKNSCFFIYEMSAKCQNKFSKFFDAPITCSPRKVNRLAQHLSHFMHFWVGTKKIQPFYLFFCGFL
jgi:hypothetical protein